MTTKVLAGNGGGTGFRLAVVEGQHIRVIDDRLSIDGITPDRLVDFIRVNAEQVDADAISIFTSGWIVDGVIEQSTNTHLPPNLPLLRLIAEATRLPTLVMNDAVAETKGASTVFNHLPLFDLIIIGGGVGQRKFDHGRIDPFDERGHMTIDLSLDAPRCACGLRGDVESHLGGNNLAKRVRLAPIIVPNGLHPCTFLDQEWLVGAQWATNIYFRYAQMLGVYLANLQLHDNVPDIIFRGSTVTKVMGLKGIEPFVRQAMRDRLPPNSPMAEAKFHFLPERPDMPDGWDGFLGAAVFAEELLAKT